jgi:hypothetical protein
MRRRKKGSIFNTVYFITRGNALIYVQHQRREKLKARPAHAVQPSYIDRLNDVKSSASYYIPAELLAL